MHDSFTPLGGGVPLVNMMLGEVSPGGVGAGLYGMLIFVLLSVFIAGLMVGRTPEYLGKKIQAARDEARRALHPRRAVARARLHRGLGRCSTRAGVDPESRRRTGSPRSSTRSRPPANNNGSAFGGLNGNTEWYNTTLGICDAGRPLLADHAGAGDRRLARRASSRCRRRPGTFPTDTPLFAGAARRRDRRSSSA